MKYFASPPLLVKRLLANGIVEYTFRLDLDGVKASDENVKLVLFLVVGKMILFSRRASVRIETILLFCFV
jgi:hypothetical protein